MYWWLSCYKFTVYVRTDNTIITEAAPIVRRFIGQNINNLIRWMQQFGGFRFESLDFREK